MFALAAFASSILGTATILTGSPGPLEFNCDVVVGTASPLGASGVTCVISAGGLDGEQSVTVSGNGHYPGSACSLNMAVRVEGDFDLYVADPFDNSPAEIDLILNGNYWATNAKIDAGLIIDRDVREDEVIRNPHKIR